LLIITIGTNNNPQTMEEQFKKLKNAYIKLKNNFQIQQGIKQSLEDENKNLKSKIEELEKKNKELKKELANLKGEEQISESQVLRKENEKIEQLETKKAEIEYKFLILRDVDFDSSEKKFSGQKELFDKIKLIRNSVEDTLSILQEQRQVDVAFFQNCKNLDQTIENIKKVDQDIIKLGDLFSKLNQGIKKNIEICQRKIINTLQKIGERENIDVSFIEEILNEASNYLKKYEENIIKYGKITEEIIQKNNEAKDLLNSTKEKLDEFLIELNQKVISEMKKVTPNPKEEDFYSQNDDATKLPKNAGTYTVKVDAENSTLAVGGFNAPNEANIIAGTLTIHPKPITITINDVKLNSGDESPKKKNKKL